MDFVNDKSSSITHEHTTHINSTNVNNDDNGGNHFNAPLNHPHTSSNNTLNRPYWDNVPPISAFPVIKFYNFKSHYNSNYEDNNNNNNNNQESISINSTSKKYFFFQPTAITYMIMFIVYFIIQCIHGMGMIFKNLTDINNHLFFKSGLVIKPLSSTIDVMNTFYCNSASSCATLLCSKEFDNKIYLNISRQNSTAIDNYINTRHSNWCTASNTSDEKDIFNFFWLSIALVTSAALLCIILLILVAVWKLFTKSCHPQHLSIKNMKILHGFVITMGIIISTLLLVLFIFQTWKIYTFKSNTLLSSSHSVNNGLDFLLSKDKHTLYKDPFTIKNSTQMNHRLFFNTITLIHDSNVIIILAKCALFVQNIFATFYMASRLKKFHQETLFCWTNS